MMTSKRKYRAIVFSGALIILLAGLYSWIQANLEALPSIREHGITIDIAWPRQPANNVETQVTNRLEALLANLPHLKSQTSYTTNGQSHIELRFHHIADIDEMFNIVNARVNSVQGLPYDIHPPSLTLIGGEEAKLATIAIYGSRKSPSQEVSWAQRQRSVQTTLAADLRAISGIKSVQFWGDYIPVISITFDAEMLKSLQLNPSDLLSLIRERYSITPSTTLNLGKREQSILIETDVLSTQTLGELDIVTEYMGMVKLSELAKIEQIYDSRSPITYVDGHEGLVLEIVSDRREDQAQLIQQVVAAIERFNTNSQDIQASIFFDASELLQDSHWNLLISLLIASIFCFIILYFFNGRNLQVSGAVFLAIPFCFLATYLVLGLLDHSTNILVLAGLAFASGMVIDNAVVVVHMVIKLRNEGVSFSRSIRQGIVRTRAAIFAGTLTTIISMLPVFLISDGMGVLLKEMLVPVAIALSVSLIYAITLAPLLLTSAATTGNICAGVRPRLLLFKRPVFNGGIILAVIAACFLAFSLLPSPGFLPDSRTPIVQGQVFPEPSLSIQTKQALRDKLQDYITQADVRPTENTPSFLYLATNTSPPMFHYRFTEQENAEQLSTYLNKQPNVLPDAYLASRLGTLLPSEKTSSVTLYVAGSDINAASKIAKHIWARIPEVLPNASVSYPWVGVNALQKRFAVDRQQAAYAGFSQLEIAQNLAAYSSGILISRMVIDEQLHDIQMQIWPPTQDIDNIVLFSRQKGESRISDLGDSRETYFASYIPHKNGRRIVSMTISLPSDLPMGLATEKLNSKLIKNINVPPGISIYFDENISEFNALKQQTLGVFFLSCAFIYLVLVAFFSNLWVPLLLIISTLPGIAGGAVGVYLVNQIFGIGFNLVVASGFVLLIGIIINNGILLFGEVIRLADNNLGDSRITVTLIQLAVSHRIYPIAITTVTNIVGFIPLLININAGSEFYAGIAALMIFGLIFSLVSCFMFLPSLIMFFRNSIYPSNKQVQSQTDISAL